MDDLFLTIRSIVKNISLKITMSKYISMEYFDIFLLQAILILCNVHLPGIQSLRTSLGPLGKLAYGRLVI